MMKLRVLALDCDGTIVEERHRLGELPDFNDAVIRAVHERYGAPAELL